MNIQQKKRIFLLIIRSEWYSEKAAFNKKGKKAKKHNEQNGRIAKMKKKQHKIPGKRETTRKNVPQKEKKHREKSSSMLHRISWKSGREPSSSKFHAIIIQKKIVPN